MQLYDSSFVEQLFDEMSGTYGLVNYVSSFGFCRRWRRQLTDRAALSRGATVCDFMCGMGETWPLVHRQTGGEMRLIGFDISAGMLRGAWAQRARLQSTSIDIRRENALANSLADGSIDVVLCGVGIKTLSAPQAAQLAAEVHRVLRPGGRFAMIEISVPRRRWLRGAYMFYLKWIIPLIGKICLGNPDCYRYLGIYTERFGDCAALLSSAGLETRFEQFFWGCATGVWGRKPGLDGPLAIAPKP
ncbi:MAG: class I SAM-dependent methyltransferase [Pirellulales bacterium]